MIVTEIVQVEVTCDWCKYGEVVSVSRDLYRAAYHDAALLLGFTEARVETIFGAYIPKVCVRCQNRMTRLDRLSLGIQLDVKMSHRVVTAKKIVDTLTHGGYFSQAEIESETWKLIEKGVLQVDEKGIITKCKE